MIIFHQQIYQKHKTTNSIYILGIYPNNFVIQESYASLFTEMLTDGKNVYMEGGSTWAFDTNTSLHSMFGIDTQLSLDGSSDLEITHRY